MLSRSSPRGNGFLCTGRRRKLVLPASDRVHRRRRGRQRRLGYDRGRGRCASSSRFSHDFAICVTPRRAARGRRSAVDGGQSNARMRLIYCERRSSDPSIIAGMCPTCRQASASVLQAASKARLARAERTFRGLKTTCACKPKQKKKWLRARRCGDREADRVDTAVPDDNTG